MIGVLFERLRREIGDEFCSKLGSFEKLLDALFFAS